MKYLLAVLFITNINHAQSMVRPVLWDLSKHAAGEYINFTTNSNTIYVGLTVKGAQEIAQMLTTI
jgi:hypothetical protein